MAQNRVQFRPGLSLPAFMAKFVRTASAPRRSCVLAGLTDSGVRRAMARPTRGF